MEAEAVASPSEGCSYGADKTQLAWVQGFVLANFILLLFLFPVARFRLRARCRNPKWSTALKLIALLVNAAILSLIPYTYGLMRNLPHRNDLVSIWAVFLLYVYVNTPDFVSFNDSLSIGVAYVKLCLYGYYITVIIYTSYARAVSENLKRWFPAKGAPRLYSMLDVLVVTKAVEIMFSRALLTYDGKLIWLRILRFVKSHLRHDIDRSMSDAVVVSSSSNEDPRLRCNYDVCRFFFVKKITVQEIWGIGEDEGCILSSSPKLKNYCLSLSLLWKLFPVFGGRRSYESGSDQEEAWNLVRNGLLDCGNRCRPFRVIEVELALLHHYITNSSCFISYKLGFPAILVLHLMRLVGIIWVGCLTLGFAYHQKGKTVGIMDVLLTWMIVLSSIVVELEQFYDFVWSSRWNQMMLLCIYLIRKSWAERNPWDRFITKVTEIYLWPTLHCGSSEGELFKPQQTQLGQYSLLETYSHLQTNVFLPWFVFLTILAHLTGNRFVRLGVEQSNNVSLTSEIKEVVINTLLARGRHLTSGIATLEASDQLSPETKRNLVWACTQIHTKAQVVLLWHIATSLCEIDELKWKRLPQGDDAFNVATTLSKYCAYLVAFAPDMLPGNVANTNYTCNAVIDEAYRCLEGCKGPILYDKLMKIADKYDDPDSKREVASILEQGAVIGKVLVTQVDDPRARWDVLAGFWAEMILYLAPNDHNEWAHVERLADGGEFITHVWALLFHAGVVDRDSLSRDPKVDIPDELDQV